MELQEIRGNLEKMIKENKIVVFSKSYCPYALKAKQTLDNLTKNYLVIELNGHPQGSEIQEILAQMTGASTVPRVFVGGVCIGGGDDTVRLYKSGELEKMITN
ncbi:glutaredoxin [Folsomia candida]|uniref:Glutaredoxin-2, mitochondrial n=1 Tax=Folsomia candida TaxID=158441 RepID=A0A226F1D4_FOLCA|nr:glutaredoxin [Folsomia candida]OXA63595.1 Monothiol glutaredoxin-S6 [Folsomia candida]